MKAVFYVITLCTIFVGTAYGKDYQAIYDEMYNDYLSQDSLNAQYKLITKLYNLHSKRKLHVQSWQDHPGCLVAESEYHNLSASYTAVESCLEHLSDNAPVRALTILDSLIAYAPYDYTQKQSVIAGSRIKRKTTKTNKGQHRYYKQAKLLAHKVYKNDSESLINYLFTISKRLHDQEYKLGELEELNKKIAYASKSPEFDTMIIALESAIVFLTLDRINDAHYALSTAYTDFTRTKNDNQPLLSTVDAALKEIEAIVMLAKLELLLGDEKKARTLLTEAGKKYQNTLMGELGVATMVYQTIPDYPKELLNTKKSAQITLRGDIDENGAYTNIEVIENDGHSLFAARAIEAASQTIYIPLYKNDSPTVIEGVLQYVDFNNIPSKPSPTPWTTTMF